jgi:hypothetical protein
VMNHVFDAVEQSIPPSGHVRLIDPLDE